MLLVYFFHVEVFSVVSSLSRSVDGLHGGTEKGIRHLFICVRRTLVLLIRRSFYTYMCLVFLGAIFSYSFFLVSRFCRLYMLFVLISCWNDLTEWCTFWYWMQLMRSFYLRGQNHDLLRISVFFEKWQIAGKFVVSIVSSTLTRFVDNSQRLKIDAQLLLFLYTRQRKRNKPSKNYDTFWSTLNDLILVLDFEWT